MRDPRGLTLIELMVGSLLVFGAALTMATVVASSSHYMAHERERTNGLQIAWQEAQVIDSTFLVNGQVQTRLSGVKGGQVVAPFDGQDAGYFSDGGGLAMITVNVDLPSGHQMSFETLQHTHALQDVACSQRYVILAGNSPYNLVHIFDKSTQSMVREIPAMPTMPPPPPVAPGTPAAPSVQRACGLATDQAFNYIRASDDVWPGIHTLFAPLTGQWPGHAQEEAPPMSHALLAGMASDPAGTETWSVDMNLRAVWHQTTGGVWDRPYRPLRPAPPLLLPSQLTWDRDRHRLWVTDQGNVCLRRFDIPTLSFDDILYRDPTMGSPRGVAVVSTGPAIGTVYTADARNLWSLAPTGTWTHTALPTELQFEVAGLCFDPWWPGAGGGTASRLLINTDNVSLFTYDPLTGQFSGALMSHPDHDPWPGAGP